MRLLRLVVDANVIVAALLRDSTTRRLLILGGHELHAPRLLFEEIGEHWAEFVKRSGIPPEALQEVLRVLRGYISEHDWSEYADSLRGAQAALDPADVEDAPYLALASFLSADGVWTEDRRLLEQAAVKTFRTRDLLR